MCSSQSSFQQKEDWRYRLCDLTESETEVYNTWKNTTEEWYPETRIERQQYIEIIDRHYDCIEEQDFEAMYCTEDEEIDRGRRLDLSILQVCRQTHEEATKVLYASNTFSFWEPTMFAKFVSARDLVQKQAITRLHLSISWNHGESLGWDMRGVREWNRALEKKTVVSLKGLRVVHMQIDHCIKDHDWPFLKEHLEGSGFANGVMNLQVLPLEDVTVVVEYSLQDGKHGDGPGLPWKLRDRHELSGQMTKILLDAGGATKYQERMRNMKEKKKAWETALTKRMCDPQERKAASSELKNGMMNKIDCMGQTDGGNRVRSFSVSVYLGFTCSRLLLLPA